MRWAREAWGDRNDPDPRVRASTRALLACAGVCALLVVNAAVNVALLLGAGA